MKLRYAIALGLVFVISCGAWASYMISRRAFLHDFNDGVHAYLSGNFNDAEQSLMKALARRPHDAKVRQLATKVLIERSFTEYHKGDFAAAQATLAQASALTPADDPAQRGVAALRAELAIPANRRPVQIEKVLDQLYTHLPARDQPEDLHALMDRWFQRSAENQEALLDRFSANQERWLTQLAHEKESFKTILLVGLVLFGLAGLGLIGLWVVALNTYFGRRGIFPRMLEEHHRRLIAVLPPGTQVLLGPPVSLLSIPETRRLDAIEAEIVSGRDDERSSRELRPMLEREDPWIRARAAKILYRLDPRMSLEEIKRLVTDVSVATQVPGIWALSELASLEAIEMLAPLAYSSVREIQQGAVRSLLQLQARADLPVETREKLSELLTEIRSRTGWIF